MSALREHAAWYRDPAARRFIALGYLPWLAGLNLAWEIAHLPLYTIWTDSSAGYMAFAVLHCTLGDLMIGSAALLLGLIAGRESVLERWSWRRIAVCTAVLGMAYTAFSEWLNVAITQSWAYSSWMPVIDVAGVRIGVSPLLQWLVIPPLALYFARKGDPRWRSRPKSRKSSLLRRAPKQYDDDRHDQRDDEDPSEHADAHHPTHHAAHAAVHHEHGTRTRAICSSFNRIFDGEAFVIRPVLVLVLAAATQVSAAGEVSVAATHRIAIETAGVPRNASHELRLALYVFRGTRWTQEEIEAAVAQAGRLIGQCGVALAGARLHVIEAPRRFHFYSTPVSRALLRELAASKPAVFFVEDTRNEPAYDAEAIGRGNASSRPELADTVWVAYGAKDLPQVLAHELVHVLSNSGEHSEAPGNLMAAGTSPGRTELSRAQCERMRSTGAANGLMSARAPRRPAPKR